jgi:hypothetical protein
MPDEAGRLPERPGDARSGIAVGLGPFVLYPGTP